MSFDLFPSYDVELPPEPVTPEWELPVRPNLDDPSIHDIFVDDPEKAERLLALLSRLPLGAIAIDTEFGNTQEEVILERGRTWSDPRSINPLLLSGAAWVPERRRILRFAIDLRRPGIASRLGQILRLNTVFVAHFFQAEFHTLWAMGLEPVLHQVWDTYVAAKALNLGDGFGQVDAAQESEPHLVGANSLLGQCAKYEIGHPYASAKDQLQRSFLSHRAEAPFNDLQIGYALADAEATLRLYLAQQPDMIAAGLTSHLYQVEFPFAEANARMIWNGVHPDQERLTDLRDGLDQAIELHRKVLVAAGLKNPGSPKQVRTFLHSRGHGDRLMEKGKASTSDSVLERIEPLDPLITDIRRYRRYSALRHDPMFDGALFGADGRLHPFHRHLGASTGRNTCSAPNIVGISKTFRPVVTAPDGRALIELDFAQIEVCVAAAVHGDRDLLEAANSSDVYAAMAQRFFEGDLTDDEQALPPHTFKTTRKDLRDKMKVFVLAVTFNMADQGVADQFGVSLSEAQRQRAAFLERFPGVAAALKSVPEDGALRGFAPIIGGLRRKIGSGVGAANQHVNSPVQGSAGVVFRKAVVDMYRHFRGTPTKIVLPIHDAVLIECDVGDVDTVSRDAAFIMGAAVRAYFPELHPRIDVNAQDISCWNKDGRSDSLAQFLQDPSFKLV